MKGRLVTGSRAEDFALWLVTQGLLSVDSDGYIWRSFRSHFSRWSSVSTLKRIAKRRAESSTSEGYLCLQINWHGVKYSCLAHRVTFRVWKGPIADGLQINHIDGCKSNNNPANLEAVTLAENNRHAWATGLDRGPDSENARTAKLTADDAVRIRLLHSQGTSSRELSVAYGVVFSTIRNVVTGKTWRRA